MNSYITFSRCWIYSASITSSPSVYLMADTLAKKARLLRRGERPSNKIDRKDCIFWKLETN